MILDQGPEKQITIDKNRIAERHPAPIVVEWSGRRIQAGEVRIKGESEVLYSLHQTAANNRVWITTTAEVELLHVVPD